MKYGALFGWGIVIYAVMELAGTVSFVYGFSGTMPGRAFGLLVLIIVATIAGRSLRFHSSKDIFPYSFGWMIIVALLDYLVTVPGSGWAIYSDWDLWFGYGLVVLVPLLSPYTLAETKNDQH